MTESTNCFSGIDKQELKRNSIFLLPYQNEREKGKKPDRDFEFFVFVDPKDKNERPDFLNVLYHYLIKDTFPDPAEKYINDLKNWLGIDENSSLIHPLNWLKIAIERYPYRLFVVIDSEKWTVNGCNLLDPTFWSDKSLFLHKRICWIEYNSLIDNEPSEIKEKLLCAWLNHMKKLRPDLSIENAINIGIKTEGEDNNGRYSPPTLPWSCFEKTTNMDSKNGQQRCKDVIEISGTLTHGIVFNRHKPPDAFGNEVINDNWSNILYYENISGSQFQYPILLRKDRNTLPNVMETGIMNIAIIDERYLEWWGPNKERILFLRIFAINKYRGFEEIAKDGCSLSSDYSIGDLNDFKLSRGNEKIYPDILIIHQGIIDKLKLKSSDLLMMKDTIPFLVVTSGRGRPHDLPSGTKFLSFSSIEFFLMSQYPEKFLFIKMVMRL